MMRMATAAVLAVLAGGAAAVEIDDATQWLAGEWQNQFQAETWSFGSDGMWTQYVGGEIFESAYEIEARPANTFAVISRNTGSTYIVHRRSEDSMSVFKEGETASVGSFARIKD